MRVGRSEGAKVGVLVGSEIVGLEVGDAKNKDIY